MVAVIPALKRLRQKDCHEFKASFGLHSELKVILNCIAILYPKIILILLKTTIIRSRILDIL